MERTVTVIHSVDRVTRTCLLRMVGEYCVFLLIIKHSYMYISVCVHVFVFTSYKHYSKEVLHTIIINTLTISLSCWTVKVELEVCSAILLSSLMNRLACRWTGEASSDIILITKRSCITTHTCVYVYIITIKINFHCP